MAKTEKRFQFGEHTVCIETGEIARQATGAVVVDMAGTMVLVTVVGNKDMGEDRGFLPLMVVYQERTYAGGKIPGGFFKREGRPSAREVLTSRLIDRPIRPLFPDGFQQEVQVVATVLSLNPEVPADIPAMLGTSAALAISGIPFGGPIGAARVGFHDGRYLLNPSPEQLETSGLDLVVAGTEHAVLMVESQANELPEEVMLDAVMFGHEQMQAAIHAINELAAEVGKPQWELEYPEVDDDLKRQVEEIAAANIAKAYQVTDKLDRYSQLDRLREETLAHLVGEEEGQPTIKEVTSLFKALEKDHVRQTILEGKQRIDGREHTVVRPITIKTGILERTHGSALFTRGETQAIVVATLGTDRDAQIIDAIEGEYRDRFMLHYNFPPYCVGETGMIGSPKRREIGHGRLARRSVEAVLPDESEFPYTLRVVSEITESNGSSSMASVCGTSLALMDAGVPIKAPVAGIAMGLIKEGDQYAILTDILGDEDHLGDMDFKVAGTARGVTALQMDIKIEGITKEIMDKALIQAKAGRLHILDEMSKAIEEPRTDLSLYAPRIISVQIDPKKIGDVIGKGGSTIRALTEETGASIDISDDGLVKIFAVDSAAAQTACDQVERLTADVEAGQVYEGVVMKITDFGAFVNILPGKDGLVHISQITQERVREVSDHLSEGQLVKVKVLEVDRQGRIRLSMKEVAE